MSDSTQLVSVRKLGPGHGCRGSRAAALSALSRFNRSQLLQQLLQKERVSNSSIEREESERKLPGKAISGQEPAKTAEVIAPTSEGAVIVLTR